MEQLTPDLPTFSSFDEPEEAGSAPLWGRTIPRRQFLKTAAGASSALLSSGLWLPALASSALASATAAPRPIRGGTMLFPQFGNTLTHIYPLTKKLVHDPSTIDSFKGTIAVAAFQGTATLKKAGNPAANLLYAADIRLLVGTYRGLDGRQHKGAFGVFLFNFYQGQRDIGHQVLHISPGIASSGLAFTTALPVDSIRGPDTTSQSAASSGTAVLLDKKHHRGMTLDTRKHPLIVSGWQDLFDPTAGKNPPFQASFTSQINWGDGSGPAFDVTNPNEHYKLLGVQSAGFRLILVTITLSQNGQSAGVIRIDSFESTSNPIILTGSESNGIEFHP